MRPIVVSTCALLVGALLLVGGVAQADAKPKAPNGYKHAGPKVRAAMKKAAAKAPRSSRAGKRVGYFQGRKAPRYGFVCQKVRSSGRPTGMAISLIRRKGKWRYWRNVDSGSMQIHMLKCHRYVKRLTR